MKCLWKVAPAEPLLAARVVKEFGVSPLLAQCLLNRGLSRPDQIEGFPAPRLKQLADPFLLPDMDRAVARLCNRASARNRS